jgi:hypothetical protein
VLVLRGLLEGLLPRYQTLFRGDAQVLAKLREPLAFVTSPVLQPTVARLRRAKRLAARAAQPEDLLVLDMPRDRSPQRLSFPRQDAAIPSVLEPPTSGLGRSIRHVGEVVGAGPEAQAGEHHLRTRNPAKPDPSIIPARTWRVDLERGSW